MDNLFVSSTVGSKNKRENNIWWWCKMLQRIRKELFSTICRITMRWRTKCNGWQTMKSLINYITQNIKCYSIGINVHEILATITNAMQLEMFWLSLDIIKLIINSKCNSCIVLKFFVLLWFSFDCLGIKKRICDNPDYIWERLV